jgi:hypothetical protein
MINEASCKSDLAWFNDFKDRKVKHQFSTNYFRFTKGVISSNYDSKYFQHDKFPKMPSNQRSRFNPDNNLSSLMIPRKSHFSLQFIMIQSPFVEIWPKHLGALVLHDLLRQLFKKSFATNKLPIANKLPRPRCRCKNHSQADKKPFLLFYFSTSARSLSQHLIFFCARDVDDRHLFLFISSATPFWMAQVEGMRPPNPSRVAIYCFWLHLSVDFICTTHTTSLLLVYIQTRGNEEERVSSAITGKRAPLM